MKLAFSAEFLGCLSEAVALRGAVRNHCDSFERANLVPFS